MKLFSHRFFALVFTVWLVVVNSSKATADEVLVILCDLPYGYRYVPVLFGRDKLFEISGSSQKELCSDQDSVLTYENGRVICRYATVATKAIMRSDVEDNKREVEDYNKNRKLGECETYNDLDGTSGLSISCLLNSPQSDVDELPLQSFNVIPPRHNNELDFYILRDTDASVVQWYHSSVNKIEIDFTFRTVSSAYYSISTEQSVSAQLLLSSVSDGTISRSSLRFSESVSNYRGQICK